MKFLIESGESSLIIHREQESVILELNGQRMAIHGTDLIDFDNLIGNMASAIEKKKDQELPLIKKIKRIWDNPM